MAASREQAIANLSKANRKAGRKVAGHTLLTEQFKKYLIEELFKKKREVIAALIQSALDGEVSAQREILDRALGKVKEVIEVHPKLIILDDD